MVDYKIQFKILIRIDFTPKGGRIFSLTYKNDVTYNFKGSKKSRGNTRHFSLK